MKSLSVIITILLLVMAGQLATYLKQAGALPSDRKSVSPALALHAQQPAHAGRAAPEFSNAAWKTESPE